MSINTDVSLVSSILTPEIMETINNEKPMMAVAKLVVALVEQASANILAKNMRCFDANPGDAACQLRALKLHQLAQEEGVYREAEKLQLVAQDLKKTILGRSSWKQQRECCPQKFFEKHVLPLQVSEDMLFLIMARLLTVTKIPDHTEPNGIIVTRTDFGQCEKLSGKITKIIGGKLIDYFVAHVASQLSRHSIRVIQGVAKGSEYEEMLLDQSIRQPQNRNGYAPKSFSCLIAQMLVLLKDLKEHDTVIAIKGVGKEPTLHFLRACNAGIAFLSEKEILELNQELPLIVFEGVIADEGRFKEQVIHIGFENMILACSAQEAPYEPKSTIEDVNNAKSQQLMREYRVKAQEMGLDKMTAPFFLLDHVFCSVLKHENIKRMG